MSSPPQLGDPGGFALSSRTFVSLEAAGIVQTAWRWRYNPSVPRPTGPYPPHRALAGAYLAELPTEAGYYPGDHNGCRCESVPVLRQTSTGRFDREPVIEEPDYESVLDDA